MRVEKREIVQENRYHELIGISFFDCHPLGTRLNVNILCVTEQVQ